MRFAIAAVLVAFATPALAQYDDLTKAEAAMMETIERAADPVLFIRDAVMLCPILLTRDPEQSLPRLADEGWSVSPYYRDAEDPFFDDYEAERAYYDYIGATVYVGRENYRDAGLSFCTFSLEAGKSQLSLDIAADIFDTIEVVEGKDGQYAAGVVTIDETFYVRASLTTDELYIQYTLTSQPQHT